MNEQALTQLQTFLTWLSSHTSTPTLAATEPIQCALYDALTNAAQDLLNAWHLPLREWQRTIDDYHLFTYDLSQPFMLWHQGSWTRPADLGTFWILDDENSIDLDHLAAALASAAASPHVPETPHHTYHAYTVQAREALRRFLRLIPRDTPQDLNSRRLTSWDISIHVLRQSHMSRHPDQTYTLPPDSPAALAYPDAYRELEPFRVQPPTTPTPTPPQEPRRPKHMTKNETRKLPVPEIAIIKPEPITADAIKTAVQLHGSYTKPSLNNDGYTDARTTATAPANLLTLGAEFELCFPNQELIRPADVTNAKVAFWTKVLETYQPLGFNPTGQSLGNYCHDSSLRGPNPGEHKTPPVPANVASVVYHQFTKLLQDLGFQSDDSCGGHVTLNNALLSRPQWANVYRLANSERFTDHAASVFGRRASRYCQRPDDDSHTDPAIALGMATRWNTGQRCTFHFRGGTNTCEFRQPSGPALLEHGPQVVEAILSVIAWAKHAAPCAPHDPRSVDDLFENYLSWLETSERFANVWTSDWQLTPTLIKKEALA